MRTRRAGRCGNTVVSTHTSGDRRRTTRCCGSNAGTAIPEKRAEHVTKSKRSTISEILASRGWSADRINRLELSEDSDVCPSRDELAAAYPEVLTPLYANGGRERVEAAFAAERRGYLEAKKARGIEPLAATAAVGRGAHTPVRFTDDSAPLGTKSFFVPCRNYWKHLAEAVAEGATTYGEALGSGVDEADFPSREVPTTGVAMRLKEGPDFKLEWATNKEFGLTPSFDDARGTANRGGPTGKGQIRIAPQRLGGREVVSYDVSGDDKESDSLLDRRDFVVPWGGSTRGHYDLTAMAASSGSTSDTDEEEAGEALTRQLLALGVFSNREQRFITLVCEEGHAAMWLRVVQKGKDKGKNTLTPRDEFAWQMFPDRDLTSDEEMDAAKRQIANLRKNIARKLAILFPAYEEVSLRESRRERASSRREGNGFNPLPATADQERWKGTGDLTPSERRKALSSAASSPDGDQVRIGSYDGGGIRFHRGLTGGGTNGRVGKTLPKD